MYICIFIVVHHTYIYMYEYSRCLSGAPSTATQTAATGGTKAPKKQVMQDHASS